MNIVSIINYALSNLAQNAEVFLLEKSRDEAEALNYTNPVIVIFPDWRTEVYLNAGFELIKKRTYNIDFKTQDEFDNSDSDESKSYNSSTTVDRVAEMEVLADSIFHFINFNRDYFGIDGAVKWNFPRPIIRENNGTMSGVKCTISIEFKGSLICPVD